MIYHFGVCGLDTDTLEVTREGVRQPVEPQVFQLLRFLLENRDRVIGKDELFAQIWDRRIVSDATLTSRINLARAAVGDDGRSQAVIKTFPKRGYRFVADVDVPKSTRFPPAGSAPSGPLCQGVVVLPFKELGGRDEDHLGAGITEEITLSLSRSSDIAVIATRSAMEVQSITPLVSGIGKALNARYVVRGAIQRAGGRLRVSAQLIDAEIGRHLWAERFEGSASDLFDIQDRVAENIAAVLPNRIQRDIAQRTSAELPDLSSHQAYVRAIWTLRDSGDVPRAIEDLRRLLKNDKSHALAHAQLAVLYGFLPFVTGQDDPAHVAACRSHAETALKLDGVDERVQAKAALAFLDVGEFGRALAHSEAALGRNPHSVEAIHFRGCVLCATGDQEGALSLQAEAMRLDPLFPSHYYENVIEAHYLLGDYAQEELVAELGAAFLAADLGLSPEPRDEHAAYIAHWLTGLRDDKRFIFRAAAHAQKAVDYLHGLQPKPDDAVA